MQDNINKCALSALHFIANSVAYLGLARVGGFGRFIGNAMWHALPSRRNYTINTIADRLQLTYDEAKRIAHESFRQNGQSFAELIMAPYFGFSLADEKIVIENPELLEAMRQSKRPVVAFTGHLGSWELCAGLLGDFPMEKPRLIVVRRNGSPLLNTFINSMRSARGVTVVDHRQAVFPVLRALKRSGIVAFLVDHNAAHGEAIFLPFLGKMAAVNMGPALLALRANALVWPLFLVRRAGKYVVCSDEPLDTATLEGDRNQKVHAICAHYTKVMERMVRAYPEQWFWMHHRWKTQPRRKSAPEAS
ncbi:MAG: acyltransferase [Pseudomonadota bacterium]